MIVFLTILHIIVSVILILVVLLQTGKRADLAGAFGGGGSQTAFGARGAATFLSKITTAAAVAFMLTSLGLSLVSARRMAGGSTVLPDDAPASRQAPAPTTPQLPQLPVAPDAGDADADAGTADAPAESPSSSETEPPAPQP